MEQYVWILWSRPLEIFPVPRSTFFAVLNMGACRRLMQPFQWGPKWSFVNRIWLCVCINETYCDGQRWLAHSDANSGLVRVPSEKGDFCQPYFEWYFVKQCECLPLSDMFIYICCRVLWNYFYLSVLAQKVIVVYLVKYLTGGSGVVCSFILITSWLIGRQSFFAEGFAGEPPRAKCWQFFCCLFHCIFAQGKRDFLCYSLPLGGSCLLIFRRFGASLWPVKLTIARLALRRPLVDACAGLSHFGASWAVALGHFNALCDCDKHIWQCGTSSAHYDDCNSGVVGLELEGPSCELAIATSRPPSLYLLFCDALLQNDVALMLTPFLICERSDIDFIRLDEDWYLFNALTTLFYSCSSSRPCLHMPISIMQQHYSMLITAPNQAHAITYRGR